LISSPEDLPISTFPITVFFVIPFCFFIPMLFIPEADIPTELPTVFDLSTFSKLYPTYPSTDSFPFPVAPIAAAVFSTLPTFKLLPSPIKNVVTLSTYFLSLFVSFCSCYLYFSTFFYNY